MKPGDPIAFILDGRIAFGIVEEVTQRTTRTAKETTFTVVEKDRCDNVSRHYLNEATDHYTELSAYRGLDFLATQSESFLWASGQNPKPTDQITLPPQVVSPVPEPDGLPNSESVDDLKDIF